MFDPLKRRFLLETTSFQEGILQLKVLKIPMRLEPEGGNLGKIQWQNGCCPLINIQVNSNNQNQQNLQQTDISAARKSLNQSLSKYCS